MYKLAWSEKLSFFLFSMLPDVFAVSVQASTLSAIGEGKLTISSANEA